MQAMSATVTVILIYQSTFVAAEMDLGLKLKAYCPLPGTRYDFEVTCVLQERALRLHVKTPATNRSTTALFQSWPFQVENSK